MNKKIVGIIGGIVVIAAGIALYTSANDKSSDNKTSTMSSSNVSGKVLSLGSTALQPLAEQVAKSFQEKNPNVTITVQGGGSGAGLSQVSDGSAQIGNSDVFAEEKDGIDATKLVDHKVAVVGIAPVVNSDVQITSLTKEQLRNIFTGKVTNWKEVGGNDEKIVVINRATGSGTRAVFEKNILDGQDAVQATEQDSNGTVQKIVKTTPGSISYLAFAYLDSDGIKALDLNKVHPNKKNVEDNSWPIWAYEHMYTKGKTTGATKSFLEYFTTKEVQKNIVPKLGYIGLTDMKVTRDASGKVTD
ncbi:phosphate ABC transporter substrate-binding protein [Leuconostoc mesenteroides]|uniref:phosphate ABC transporter substrate-binding protein n=1 Tax=Leuconostoc mesenteroides TaxID=1245 RepID=UPI002072C558|nr:phosphate ABC transporter substrate-binding protein [Leuconostoc mesenteroides]MCM6826508.1 phosphate ABC transporter substrate-binding protein [Leuconostoc mesenteroides]